MDIFVYFLLRLEDIFYASEHFSSFPDLMGALKTFDGKLYFNRQCLSRGVFLPRGRPHPVK